MLALNISNQFSGLVKRVSFYLRERLWVLKREVLYSSSQHPPGGTFESWQFSGKKTKTKSKNNFLSPLVHPARTWENVGSKQGFCSHPHSRKASPEPRVHLAPACHKKLEYRQFPFKLRSTNISGMRKTQVATQNACG